ncbi:MAG TPA: DUF4833 domain-containing protein [Polyangiaceae bacterium]|jgi:hypothetical protein
MLRRTFPVAGLFAVVMATAGDAQAAPISFGQNDVPTVFFINKSDDHNRVDYGIRLNEHCAPTGDDAVFPYWREFEHAPPVRTHSLGMFEYVPYGFAEQRLVHRTSTGGDQLVRLKQLARPILVRTKKLGDGRCEAIAYARIGGVEGAVLDSVYAKLAGAMSVEYIDVHGKNPATGAELTERVRK